MLELPRLAAQMSSQSQLSLAQILYRMCIGGMEVGLRPRWHHPASHHRKFSVDPALLSTNLQILAGRGGPTTEILQTSGMDYLCHMHER